MAKPIFSISVDKQKTSNLGRTVHRLDDNSYVYMRAGLLGDLISEEGKIFSTNLSDLKFKYLTHNKIREVDTDLIQFENALVSIGKLVNENTSFTQVEKHQKNLISTLEEIDRDYRFISDGITISIYASIKRGFVFSIESKIIAIKNKKRDADKREKTIMYPLAVFYTVLPLNNIIPIKIIDKLISLYNDNITKIRNDNKSDAWLSLKNLLITPLIDLLRYRAFICMIMGLEFSKLLKIISFNSSKVCFEFYSLLMDMTYTVDKKLLSRLTDLGVKLKEVIDMNDLSEKQFRDKFDSLLILPQFDTFERKGLLVDESYNLRFSGICGNIIYLREIQFRQRSQREEMPGVDLSLGTNDYSSFNDIITNGSGPNAESNGDNKGNQEPQKNDNAIIEFLTKYITGTSTQDEFHDFISGMSVPDITIIKALDIYQQLSDEDRAFIDSFNE